MLSIFTLTRRLRTALAIMERNNMDTSRLLDAVRQEKTENASLRTLLKANTEALKGTSAQITDMSAQIANLNTALAAALATSNNNEKDEQIAALKVQVADLQKAADAAQADVDQAVADLDADNEDTAAAITENTIPAEAPPAPETPPADTGSGDQSSGSMSGTEAKTGEDTSQQSSGDAPKDEPQPQQ